MRSYRSSTGVATAALVTLVATGFGRAATAQPKPAFTVDFEDVPANRSGSPAAPSITDRYAGVGLIFETPVTPLIYDDESIPALEGFARSGRTVITTCYSVEFCSNEIVVRLNPPRAGVELWVGYQQALSTPAELVVTGFAGDDPVSVDRVVLGPSDGPIAVTTPATVLDDAGRLDRIDVRWAEPFRYLSGLAVDDIGLVPFGLPPEVVATPESLVLDARGGPATDLVVFHNVGSVDVAVAEAVLVLADDADESLSIVDSTCAGMVPPEGSCEVRLSFDPGQPADDATGMLTLLARDGEQLLSVPVTGLAPAVTEGESPDEPEERTVVEPTTDDGEWGSAVPALVRRAAGPASLAVLLLGGLVAAVRRTTRRRRPPDPPPQVRCRLVDDAGIQTVEHTSRPLLGIRASTRPQHGQITIDVGEADREEPPR